MELKEVRIAQNSYSTNKESGKTKASEKAGTQQVSKGTGNAVYHTVKKGDNVVKGEVIATMGKTGNATGNNLHFAIYKNGYVDPLPYLTNENPFNKVNDNYTTFVRDLQSVIGANVDGIAGAETLSKTPTISTGTGWNHKAVKPLQIYLQSLGYDLGSCGVDGEFGKDMKACIKKYQSDVGLASKYQDGKVSAKMYTWQHLLKLN